MSYMKEIYNCVQNIKELEETKYMTPSETITILTNHIKGWVPTLKQYEPLM